MKQAIILKADVGAMLMPANPDRDTRHRIGRFASWLASNAQPWHKPDLAAYRDNLTAEGLAARTIAAHLSTIRGAYGRVITDNETRQALFDQAAAQGLTGPADRAAFVNETITRIQNAIDPARSSVKITKSQDQADSAHVRLSKAQADVLLAAPGARDLDGIRDTAVIATLLCTGIREAELCALDVADLRQALGGELALHVRRGKGAKERLVPYGALDWVLVVVDAWRAAAGIEQGPVFQSFKWQAGDKVLQGRLTTRSVQRIIARYPVTIGGELVHVKPHDCRRTYARRLYEAGVDLVAIQQNLGHANLKTTLGYIGELDAGRRRPPAVYTFDLASLAGVPIQGRL